ncbi:MAG: RNA-binding protein, partial [Pseudorhodobacter sp.]|nr:RNA-binding protein [Frankiaceae bacterium]
MTLAGFVEGVRVLFAHDTEVALQAAAALVNTEL